VVLLVAEDLFWTDLLNALATADTSKQSTSLALLYWTSNDHRSHACSTCEISTTLAQVSLVLSSYIFEVLEDGLLEPGHSSRLQTCCSGFLPAQALLEETPVSMATNHSSPDGIRWATRSSCLYRFSHKDLFTDYFMK
jgi:hypothetical protein